MNGPVVSCHLVPANAELVERMPMFPEEPTFSYVNRIVLVTAATKRRQVVEDLFGNPAIRPDRPFHAGFGYLAALSAQADGTQPVNLLQRHGLIALFAPFVAKESYRHAVEMAHGQRANGINEVLGIRPTGVYRDHPAVCLHCVKDDMAKGDAAHHRRVHKISAVIRCPEHGSPLVSACGACGTPMSHEQQPSLNCRNCGFPLTVEDKDSAGSQRLMLQFRLAKFIQASISGALPMVDAAIRLAVLRERASRVIESRSKVVGDNLAMHLNRAYGRDLLEALALRTDAAPTLGWPTLLLQGRLLASDPIANCLLIAAFFDSVEDYVGELQNAKAQHNPARLDRKALIGANWITMAALKDVFRPMLLKDVAKKHGINQCSLRKWVAGVPGLSDRRKISGMRVTLRANKKTILEFLGRSPGESRSRVAAAHKAEVGSLFRNDRAWLDQHLPIKEKLSGAVVRTVMEAPSESDQALATRLRAAIASETESVSRPKRLHRDRVLRQSGLLSLPETGRASFPLTMAIVAEVTETVEQYYRRSLAWAVRDLRRCYGQCKGVIEMFVHARVSVEYVARLEPYAQKLLAAETK